MNDYITELVKIMKYCIEHYGLWQTVLALVILLFGTSVAFHLPKIIELFIK